MIFRGLTITLANYLSAHRSYPVNVSMLKTGTSSHSPWKECLLGTRGPWACSWDGGLLLLKCDLEAVSERSSSDYHQTLSSPLLLRLSSEPAVGFRLQAVICDARVLSASEGFPLEAGGHVQSGGTGLLSVPCIPALVRCGSGLALHADSTAVPQFAHETLPLRPAERVRGTWCLLSTRYASRSERARHPFLIDLGHCVIFTS